MHAPKVSYIQRFTRIGRLLGWLAGSTISISRMNGAPDEVRNKTISKIANSALKALDVQLIISYQHQQLELQSTLIVANHISWLDILALNAVCPSCFIAKKEISRWPVVGKMGRNVGTVFINRNSNRDIDPINTAISKALQDGKNVSFFPEARTTSGNTVLPFKAALFQAAVNSAAPVQPIALRYYSGTQQRTTAPSYVGNMNLIKSLWRIVSVRHLHIRIDFGPLIPSNTELSNDRFSIKTTAETYISAKVNEDSPKDTTPTN